LGYGTPHYRAAAHQVQNAKDAADKVGWNASAIEFMAAHSGAKDDVGSADDKLRNVKHCLEQEFDSLVPPRS
jgi:hypothetical protein